MRQINDLKLFVAVAETGTLSQAAQQLGIAVSSVSERLLQLERRLGCSLLTRTSRQQALTPAGRLFLPRCRSIIAQMTEAEQELRGEREALAGSIRVSAPVPLGRRLLAPLVAEFMAVQPQIRIELLLGTSPLDLMASQVDVAIRGGVSPQPHFVARELFRCRRIVVASPDYLRRHGEPHALAQLIEHRCLRYGSEAAVDGAGWWFNQGGARHRVAVGAGACSNDAEVLLQWAIAGVGLLRRSAWELAEPLRDGRLREVLPGTASDAVTFYETHLVKSRHSRRVAAFVDHLHAALPARLAQLQSSAVGVAAAGLP